MKKLLGIVVLGLLWCNVGFADQPVKVLMQEGYKITKEELFTIKGFGLKIITLQKKNGYAICTINLNTTGHISDANCKTF
jgi:hypothetical protein